ELSYVASTPDLSAVVASLSPGGFVVLAPGNYVPESPLDLKVSATILGPVVPGATGGALVSGGAVTVPPSDTPDTFRVESGASVTMKYLSVRLTDPAATGMDVFGSLDLENAELSQNGFAAVISEPGASVSITNSTISKNGGPGVDVQGSATLLNDTIASNKGGGIFNESGSTVSATNLIVSGNGNGKPATDPLSTHDCHSPLNTVVASLDSDGTCGATLTADPNLAPLNLYGRSTLTQPHFAGSPAIDAGSNGPCPAIDQRGAARPRTAANPCDLGAHEGSWILTSLPNTLTAGQSAHDSAQLLSVNKTAGGTVTYATY